MMEDKPLRVYRADLHIHTCLSPCGDWDMTPRAVVETSVRRKLDIIAITDHNSVENAEAAMERGRELGLTVLPGMEICSQEEAHVLALFDRLDQALSMQTFVYGNLVGDNQPELFGYQVVANAQDEVIDQNPRLLIGATTLDLNRLVDRIHAEGGLAVAAHVDKAAYSIPSQLGFIPPELPLDAVEVSFRTPPESAHRFFMPNRVLPCITSSDAHFIDEIGRVSTRFLIAEPTVAELRLALAGRDGRMIIRSHKGAS